MPASAARQPHPLMEDSDHAAQLHRDRTQFGAFRLGSGFREGFTHPVLEGVDGIFLGQENAFPMGL